MCLNIKLQENPQSSFIPKSYFVQKWSPSFNFLYFFLWYSVIMNILHFKTKFKQFFSVHHSTQLNNFLKPVPCTGLWFDGCNHCSCDDELNGKDGICTELSCPRPDNCEPGQAFFTGVNWCFCHTDPEKDVCMSLDI